MKDAIGEAFIVHERNAGPDGPASRDYPVFKGSLLGYAEDEVCDRTSSIERMVDDHVA